MLRLLVLLFALTVGSSALAKPLVVILAEPRGAETTDLIAPYAVLAESGSVEVRVIAPSLTPVRLMPGLAWIRPQTTYATLSQRPDVIVVPFMMPAYDPARDAWLRDQAKAGVRIVSICAGAETLAHAGLLDGREATTHWYEMNRLAKAYPRVRWRKDRRWIVDGAGRLVADQPLGGLRQPGRCVETRPGGDRAGEASACRADGRGGRGGSDRGSGGDRRRLREADRSLRRAHA